MSMVSNYVVFDKTSMKIKFISEETNSTITFMPAAYTPFINYDVTELFNKDIKGFTIFGPFIMLLKELAKYKRAWLQLIKPPMSHQELINCIMVDRPHFIATMTDISQMLAFKSNMAQTDVTYAVTRVIDFTNEARIAYRTYPGQLQFFSYFNQFPEKTIIVSFIALIIVSLFLWMKDKNINQLFLILFDTISVFFIKDMPRSFKRDHLAGQLIIGAWLLACSFVSIQFCNLILEEKVKAIPMKLIDSWNDLFEQKMVQIAAVEQSFLIQYCQGSDAPMALNFRDRIRSLTFAELGEPMTLVALAKNMSSGQTAYAGDRLSMIFMLMNMAELSGEKLFLDNLHISTSGGPQFPFFMASFDRKHEYLGHMNTIILWSVESGLFSKWLGDSLKDNGYDGKFENLEKEPQFKYEQATFKQMDELYLLLIGSIISIFILLLEWLFNNLFLGKQIVISHHGQYNTTLPERRQHHFNMY